MSTRTPPATVRKIVVMREAGWTLATISEKASVSISTAQRILKRNKVNVGSGESEMVEASRKKLLDSMMNDDETLEIYASHTADTVSQIRLACIKSAEALEVLKPESTAEAALVMRALAAHATMIKAHADSLRTLIPLPVSEEHLPELTIHVMTAEEEQEIRKDQELEDERLAEWGLSEHTTH